MFAAGVVDRIFRLCNASLVVLPNGGGGTLVVTEFFKQLTIIKNGARSVEGCYLLSLGGGLRDSGLESGAPINKTTAKINKKPMV